MATVIQIKRSANIGAPTTGDLVEGELAYSYDKSNDGASAKLYIEALDSGNNEVVHAIGGKYYTAKIDSATSNNTPSTLVQRDASGDFKSGNITARLYGTANTAIQLQTPRYFNLTGDVAGTAVFDGTANADIAVTIQPNSVALGTDTTGSYVANVIAGTGLSAANQGGEGANVTLSLGTTAVTAGSYGSQDTIGTFTVDQYGRITQASNVSVNIELGTHTTGDYVTNVAAGAGITVSNQGGEGATPSVALTASGVSASTYGGTTAVPVLTIDQYGRVTSAANVTVSTLAFANIVVAGQANVTADTAGDTLTFANANGVVIETNAGADTITFSLANTGVTAATYGSTTNIPVLSIDASGRVTSAANAQISTDLLISGNTGTDTVSLISETLNIVGGLGAATQVSGNTVTIINTGVASVAGTANEVTVSSSNGAVTIGLPDDVTIARNLSVAGNISVMGNLTTVNTVVLTVNDPLIALAANNISSDLNDIGFYGQYFDGTNIRHSGLVRDASATGTYRLFTNLLNTPSSGAFDFSNTSLAVANLIANITGGRVSNLTANIAVTDGGTGRGTLTNNAVLYGQGTANVGLASGTYGQILQINAGGVPVFGGLDGGSY